MEKKIRLFGLVAAIGLVAVMSSLALGQKVSRQGGGSGGDSGVQVASPSTSGKYEYQRSNIIQHVLQAELNSTANDLIDLAIAQGKHDVAGKIVLANDYAMLTIMRPDEQKHEINDVWDVNKWVPNDPNWKAVAKAPSLVKELLDVDSGVCNQVTAEWNKAWDAVTQPLHKIEQDHAAELSKMTNQEAQDWIFHYIQTHPTNKEQVRAENRARFHKAFLFARSLLTPAQRAEFDGFVTRHEQSMATATSGLVIPPEGQR